ncbi:unnamed protein product [Pleuronectes platessa]|uniref:Uncharacterized protein n=1 Tax=Pleuronectes platessa TaxID=8262 RepID=A0A9N7UU54_PLEPL|nr:unnamed protein product [Pleuronectes platessa]
MPHVLEWTQSPKMPQVPLILESQGTQSPRGCNRMLHVLGSGKCHTKVSRTTRVNSYWSLWCKTREVTRANIRIPQDLSLFSHPSEDGRLLQPLFLQSSRGRKAAQALIQLPSLSNPQPEVRGAAPSSPFSRKSPRPSSSTKLLVATRCPAGKLQPASEHTARQNHECRTLRPQSQETSQNYKLNSNFLFLFPSDW